jgi:hypothetical protein
MKAGMDEAERLLSIFERYGFRFRVSADGCLVVATPGGKPLARAGSLTIRRNAEGLARIICERCDLVAGLSPADALFFYRVFKNLPGSPAAVREVQTPTRYYPRHELEPFAPAALAPDEARMMRTVYEALAIRLIDRNKENSMETNKQQKPLFGAHNPPSVRICPHCGSPCRDSERTVCRNCGAYFQTPLAAAPVAAPDKPKPKPAPEPELSEDELAAEFDKWSPESATIINRDLKIRLMRSFRQIRARAGR